MLCTDRHTDRLRTDMHTDTHYMNYSTDADSLDRGEIGYVGVQFTITCYIVDNQL